MNTRLLDRVATSPFEQSKKSKKMWSAAKRLQPGDKVITVEGRVGVVKSVKSAPGVHKVHNFAVEDHHTYFVGKHKGVWVHNNYGEDEQAVESPSEQVNSDAAAVEAEAAPAPVTYDTLEADEVTALQSANVSNSRIAEIDSVLTAREASGEKSGSRWNNRDIVESLGYTEDQAEIIHDLGKKIRRALIDTHPDVIAVRAEISAPNVVTTKSSIRGLSLNRTEYILATRLGLWRDLRPDKNFSENFNDNDDIDDAIDDYVAPTSVSGQVDADPDIREFMADISVVTGDSKPTNVEKFLVMERDPVTNELNITRIAVVGQTGGSLPGSFFQGGNIVAAAHVHPSGSALVPGGLDHSAVDRQNIPMFMFQAGSNRTFEVGRVHQSPTDTTLTNKFREVFVGGTASSWYPYSSDYSDNEDQLP